MSFDLTEVLSIAEDYQIADPDLRDSLRKDWNANKDIVKAQLQPNFARV
jgi:hypothetical protein